MRSHSEICQKSTFIQFNSTRNCRPLLNQNNKKKEEFMYNMEKKQHKIDGLDC